MKRSFLTRSLAMTLALGSLVACREEKSPGAAAEATEGNVWTEKVAAQGTTYAMEMKGMVCGGCMLEVKDALAKVDGVPDEAVAFKRGSRPETKKVVFTAKSATLTKEQVAEALGEAAERLVIEDFKVEEAGNAS